jgi:hypothetical protein
MCSCGVSLVACVLVVRPGGAVRVRSGVECPYVDACVAHETEGRLSSLPISRLQAGDCFGESCLLYMDDDAKVIGRFHI